MQIQRHPLVSPCSGTAREIVSFHYGRRGGRKAYLQASLHADELPGMLVAHHLRARLDALEAQGLIEGEIVVVPMANPVGLSQVVQGSRFGRFDLSTGINFNRDYPHLTPQLAETLAGKLGPDATENVRIVREQGLKLLDDWKPSNEAASMKKILLQMAFDADIVLDLHCDNEAVMHLYTGTPLAEQAMPLARLLGAQAVLLARESGDHPFDEACSRTWWELAEHFGDAYPIPCACMCATVELRGETEVTHELAERDADALIAYLAQSGLIRRQEATPLPPAQCVPTPLEGVEPIVAPHGGLLVFLKAAGSIVREGDTIAQLIDPVSGTQTELRASVPGNLFARISQRFVHGGMRVAKVAGSVPFRSGKLLGD